MMRFSLAADIDCRRQWRYAAAAATLCRFSLSAIFAYDIFAMLYFHTRVTFRYDYYVALRLLRLLLFAAAAADAAPAAHISPCCR